MDRSNAAIIPQYSAMSHFNDNRFPAANLLTLLTEEQVAGMTTKYNIHVRWEVNHPDKTDLIYHTSPIDCSYGMFGIGVSEQAFHCGLRLPLIPIVRQFLAHTHIALGQLDPNSFIHFNAFQHRCLMAEVEP